MENSTEVQQALADGYATFMGERFEVEPGVLVPRGVSEVLVRSTRALFSDRCPAWLVDLGCGCGSLAIMLARAFPGARVMALDISADAARVTRRNVERFELQKRVEVRQGDMFEAIDELSGDVDAIISSPPFISSGRLASGSRALLEHEPAVAFDAGPYGIGIHQRLVREGAPLLRPGSGWLVVEHGAGQAPQVRRLIDRSARYAESAEYSESSGTFVACVAARRATD